MKYFTMAEMTNSETAKKRGIKNEPNPTQKANIETLVNELLDKVRERWGKPLRVTSGFRCDKLNTAVGGVKKSHHTLGCAADIVAGTQKDNRSLYDMIVASRLKYTQLIGEKSSSTGCQWVHISYVRDNLKCQHWLDR